MNGRSAFLLLSLMAAPAAGASGSDLPVHSQAYDRCIASAGQVDFRVADCASAEFDRQDKLLNVAYRELSTRSSGPARAALLRAERAWLSFRDEQCSYQRGLEEGGTLADVIFEGCKLELTARRVRELDGFLDLERKYGGR